MTKSSFSYHTILFLVCFIISYQSWSQTKLQLRNMEALAKYHFQAHEYYEALPIYKALDSMSQNEHTYNYPLGICYLNVAYQEDKAIECFEKCLKHPEKYPVSLNYYIGKAYHLAHELDKAIHHLEIYRSHINKKHTDILQMIDREINMCKNGKELMAKPLNLDILNLGPVINSPYPDYGPVISADQKELLFTSCRPNTTGGNRDHSDGRYFEDIYIVYHDSSGWSTPKNLGDSINTKGHDASVALSADGQYILLYRYNPDPLLASNGDLYFSELKGKDWGKAQPLPSSINTNGYEPSASLSPDGRILFFVSDRPGGYGGTDIYMVKRLPNGEWAIPTNLGSKINTPYDEDSPFMHSDGRTLYFSSSGHMTMGGFDIFVSEYDEERLEWSVPRNAGYPISTAHDDTHFSWSPDGKKIYFSSIRSDSYGEQDIYYAVIHKDESTEVLVMKGFIKDSLTNIPLQATITVTDLQTDSLFAIFNSNSSSGKYLMILPEGHFKLTIEAEKHTPCEQQIDIVELIGFELRDEDLILCPEKELKLKK